jgi:hypothetical protein
VAVEAAIVLTVIVIPLTFTVISYAYMFSFRQALSQAASEGARASVGMSTGTACSTSGPYAAGCPAQKAAADAVAHALDNYGMTCGSKNLSCVISAPTTAGCTLGHTCISVKVTFPYRSHPLLPTIPFTGWTLPPDLSFTSVVESS